MFWLVCWLVGSVSLVRFGREFAVGWLVGWLVGSVGWLVVFVGSVVWLVVLVSWLVVLVGSVCWLVG